IPRPKNAFMLYRMDKQPLLVQSFKSSHVAGSKSSKDFSRAIADMWKAETEETREWYRQIAKEERALYKQLFPEYKYSAVAKK
ncbi:high mobility group box domain-containing protein, partial [Zopfochytrium polystomum]